MIEILRPGLFTTVQDRGRIGFQRFGMPVAGAMDAVGLQVSNILVGNNKEEAALEMTRTGDTIKFHTSNIFALTGLEAEVYLDHMPLELNRAYIATKGSILSINRLIKGTRLYLSVAGGFDIPEVMGSRSTYVKAKLGGYEGRVLKKGDCIGFRRPIVTLPNLEYRVMSNIESNFYNQTHTIRVIKGPQIEQFSKKALDTFFNTPYTITSQNDRMGYRLEGKAIEYLEQYDGNIISDGICDGAIQVANNQPIIMMADRQTTGGYAKIANVVTVDLPKLAQLKEGDVIYFKQISIETAQQLCRKQAEFLHKMSLHFEKNCICNRKDYNIKVSNQCFQVAVSEIR